MKTITSPTLAKSSKSSPEANKYPASCRTCKGISSSKSSLQAAGPNFGNLPMKLTSQEVNDISKDFLLKITAFMWLAQISRSSSQSRQMIPVICFDTTQNVLPKIRDSDIKIISLSHQRKYVNSQPEDAFQYSNQIISSGRDIHVRNFSTVLDSSGVRGSVHVNDLDASLFISNDGIQFSKTRASLSYSSQL